MTFKDIFPLPIERDVFKTIWKWLPPKDKLNFWSVCRGTQILATPEEINLIRRKVFSDRHFSLLDSEVGIQTLRALRNDYRPSEEHMVVIENGDLQIVKCVHNCQQYRSSLRKIEVIALWEAKIERWRYLQSLPCYELQELRNRYRRYLLLQDEKRVFTRIFSNCNINELYLLSDHNRLRMSKAIPYGNVEWLLNVMTPVSITAFFELKSIENEFHFSGETSFAVNIPGPEGGTRRIGGLRVARLYCKKDLDSETFIDADFVGEKERFQNLQKEGIKGSVLWVEVWQNWEWTEKPLIRLLTQLVVEIFAREPEKKCFLEIDSRRLSVFISGGFQVTGEENRELRNQILKNIEFARQMGGLFPLHPSRRTPKRHLIYLNKIPYGEETEFSGKVDFDKEALPITWEEQIKKSPLLKPGSSILPKFFETDFGIHKSKPLPKK